MKPRLTAAFPLALLVLLALLTFWLDRKVQPPPPPKDGSARHDPDFIVENFHATRLGADGTPRYTLQAARMMHYPDDDTTRLDMPHFAQLSNGGAAFDIRSEQARSSADGKQVFFTGNVRLTQPPVGKRPFLLLETSALQVTPDPGIAQTDRPVTIIRGDSTITAVGLEFNHATQLLTLHSQVKGLYPPRPRR